MIKMVEQDQTDSLYVSECGMRMQREYGDTPNGNPVSGSWVLRSAEGEWIDFDMYRSDLAERNDLDLIHSNYL